ncbi:NOT2 / NOT3 / NOT5 family domain-containing protein [Ditylenchus destructor]|nr:NOT2 / NOT3 / NOT5 family domain-containing protein [Ditylenchus destructor]
MAERRKLLAEMDKCFKKIDEGFEIFDEIMAKMAEANSDNQREKFQDDLKKEIKKLQRLRDQIKGWQNSSDIKDKDNLSKFRKKIEERMETFKDIERENKTKPHSKQGLSAEDKLDPKEKEKGDCIDWLNDEIDRTESKLESMNTAESTGGRKRGKKEEAKKNDKEKIEELKKHLERVKFHLTNWEVVMRLITNEKLEIKEVLTKLKEPVEMYIEALDPDSNLDSESLDPEGLTIGGSLDDDSKAPNENGGNHRTSPTGTSPPPSAISGKDETDPKQRHQSGGEQLKQTAVTTQAATVTAAKVASTATTPLKLMRLGSRISAESTSMSSPPPATPPPPPTIPYNSIAAGIMTASTLQHQQSVNASTQPKEQLPAAQVATIAATAITKAPSTTPPVLDETKQVPPTTERQHSIGQNSATAPAVIGNGESRSISSAGSTATPPLTTPPPSAGTVPPPGIPYNSVAAGTFQASTVLPQVTPVVNSLTPATTPTQVEVTTTPQSTTTVSTTTTTAEVAPSTNLPSNVDDLNQNTLRQVLQMGQNAERKTQPQTTTIPPWLGASPLGMVPITGDLEVQLNMLESALPRVPVQMDSEKPRSYLPKMPCQTPSYYPQAPPPNADTLEYYLRLNVESLFFTFYYMEGSRAQLLAAKALKKLSWRFHTKYLMWFQRHEEPKQITDDFEQGTYVYFDFEKWAQRKREQFMFEYKYLEDKDFD